MSAKAEAVVFFLFLNCKGGLFMRANNENKPAAAVSADQSAEKNEKKPAAVVPAEQKRRAFAQITNVQVLASTGMLSAIAIVLGFLKIPVTQLIELRFQSLPIAAAGYLFGPVCAGIVGMIADVGGYLVKPTGPFFPGFTLSSILCGVIFGCVLYGKKPTIRRILAAEILYTVLCGILLNSLWLSILYGRGFIAAMSARLVKEIVMIPINTAMLAALMQPVRRYAAAERAG